MEKSVSFNAIFENNGNTEDTLSTSTALSSNCEEDGWCTVHLSAEIAVDQRATDTVEVQITSPSANATVNSCTLGVCESENGDTYTHKKLLLKLQPQIWR